MEEGILGDHWNVVVAADVVERWTFRGNPVLGSRHDSSAHAWHPPGVPPIENPVHSKPADQGSTELSIRKEKQHKNKSGTQLAQNSALINKSVN